MSGQVDDVELIKIVQSLPILYDKNMARGPRNAAMKDAAWSKVATYLRASERICVIRWKSIRDRFGKEFRRMQDKPDERTNWELFPHLLFLREHYKHGTLKDDLALDIKYEPRVRRRKTRKISSADVSQAEDSNNEDDLNPDNIITNEQLIELVRQNPVIYDKQKIRDSKHLTAKNAAWKEISTALGLSEEICWERWKKLRDRFAREYRYHQISPEHAVTWIHYQDLSFLEHHYRKGIPLDVDMLKRKYVPARSTSPAAKRATTPAVPSAFEVKSNDVDANLCNTDLLKYAINSDIADESNEWPAEYVYETVDNIEIMPAKEENLNKTNTMRDLEEFIILTDKKTTDNEIEQASCCKETLNDCMQVDSETRLTSVIKNMKAALKDSIDCLSALQQEKQKHALSEQSNIMQKIQVLLSDSPTNQRNIAECKILNFLYECQTKLQNNQDIADVPLDLSI